MILFIYRSKTQGNNIADHFNRMGVPSLVTSPENAIHNISNKYLGIVVSIPRDDYKIYDAEFVHSLKIYSLGAPIFAICDPDDLEKVEHLYAYDEIFTTDMNFSGILKGIQLHQYYNDLPRTGVYRLSGLDVSLNLENPLFYFNEFSLTHNEKMVLRTLIRMFPSSISSKDILNHSLKRANQPDASIIRTIICSVNKKFKEKFNRKVIEISEDKGGYTIITSKMIQERKK